MKSKLAFAVLVLAILGLLVGGGLMTMRLFETSIPESEISEPPPLVRIAPPTPPATVSEAVIEAQETVPAPPEVRAPVAATPAPPAAAVPAASKTPAPVVPEPAEARAIGQVTQLSGEAFAVGVNERRRPLSVAAGVFLNERIETGANTKLTIRFDDGSEMFQGEKSAIVVDKYVYEPDDAEKTNFAMRLIKGISRVVTGKIVEINPERFKVRTQLATMGIRGCDVAFRTAPDRDDVYVLELTPNKNVLVEGATDGRVLIDTDSGRDQGVPPSDLTRVDVTEPLTQVSVVQGEGVSHRRMSPEEAREILRETSHLPPARYKAIQKPDGAVLMLRPPTAPKKADEPQ